MQEVKTCCRCGEVISILADADYYKHIRQKYCDACKKQVRREQNAQSQKRHRQKRAVERTAEKIAVCGYWQDMRVKARFDITQLDLLKKENALLRERVNQLRKGM